MGQQVRRAMAACPERHQDRAGGRRPAARRRSHANEKEKQMSKGPEHVHVTYIKTTPERLWQALTDGAVTKKYYFGGDVRSDWKNGSTYNFTGPRGEAQIEGKVVESDPPRKLVTTFKAVWDDDVK